MRMEDGAGGQKSTPSSENVSLSVENFGERCDEDISNSEEIYIGKTANCFIDDDNEVIFIG
jgi:hypothetical protein